jgi:membrane-bound ClpP family serine protease
MSAADDSPVGMTGRIVTATRGDHGVGEVEVRIRGGTETFLARSPEPVSVGEPVVVVSIIGPRTVVVAPISDPIDDLLTL